MKYEYPKPIPGTSRTRVITDHGQVLEVQRIYLPAKCWAALKALASRQGKGGSEIIEDLIMLADKYN